MKHFRTFNLLICIALCCAFSSAAFAQVTIAANGKSTFTIVVPAKAPTSVKNAALELQKDIEIATNAKLPLQQDDAKISGALISLGNTQQAAAAGLSSEKMADESFRVLTRNGNLYIWGPDTPDKGWTKNNGVSNGTAHGVYTFLEDYLNVRWLMPGDIGRDVPSKSTFTLDKIDRSMTPRFMMRTVSHLYNYTSAPQYANVMAWMDHQRLGGSMYFDYNHNWWRTINRSASTTHNYGYYPWPGSSDVNTPAVKKFYEEHPEWFAMDKNGDRPYPKNHYGKLETTNPELVKWFAAEAVRTLKASERPITFSLSPSDGSTTWSKSPETQALYDPNPDSTYDPEAPQGDASMSSVVAKWYHDIAAIMAREYPQGRVSGLIYSSYVFPPQKVSAKLPDNFVPIIAPSRDYGYGLYRDSTQKYFHTVMDDWAKIVTGNWFYYDLPNQILRQRQAIGDGMFPGSTAAVMPAAPGILNIIFKQLIKSHIDGGQIYGTTSWSCGALSNYILAKMEWDPTLDANDLQKEWLHRAYGPAAGAAMEKFYAKLDDWFREYYRQNEKARYYLELGMFKDLYGAHYPEMETLFLQAKAQPMTAIQQKRLQLIEDNLIVLQWRLRKVHYLPEDFASPLQRNDTQINEMIAAGNKFDDLSMFPGATTKVVGARYLRKLPWKVLLSQEMPAGKSTLPQWDDGQFLIYAAKDGDIRITTQTVTHGGYFAAYEIKNQKGEMVSSGLFDPAAPIVIAAKAGEAYRLIVPLRSASNFQLQVQNAAVATGDLRDGTLYLSGKNAPVYVFYVPGKNPVGVFEAGDDVKIRKPYSGFFAQNYANEKYSEVRRLDAFDDGWLFSPDPQNDGIQRGVLNADFDDSSWSPIIPLDWWQMQGFVDYHGPAWYRLKFDAPALQNGETARFYFGAVDGNAVVYLNGKKIAEHTLVAPDFKGWNWSFTAPVNRAIKPGENILTVQVTSKDTTSASGIFKGVALIIGKQR